MKIRSVTDVDISELYELFRTTVLTVNFGDYTSEEVADWASCGDDTDHWKNLLAALYFIAAVDDEDRIIGFASIREDGYLHSMFVHREWQRKGVASALLSGMERHAAECGMPEITSEVSITARPFFEKHGYIVVQEQTRRANRFYLRNYRMKKVLGNTHPSC